MKRVYDEEMEEGEDQGNDGIITLTTSRSQWTLGLHSIVITTSCMGDIVHFG